MKKNYGKIVKQVCLSILMATLYQIGYATSYYVSSAGNDSNSGLTEQLAWKTLTKVNTITFKAGDQILFQRGNTFFGSLTINQSGTASNRITFGAYGTGVNPIISGFTDVSDWNDLTNNIWESKNTVSTLLNCNMVVVNGQNTPMGRFPNYNSTNGGFLVMNSNPTSTSLTNSSLTGTPNWTNAQLVIRTNSWTFDKRTITSQSTRIVNFDVACSPTPNYGFFIQNDARTLDIQNEWYYNPTTKKIKIYSVGKPSNVKVASIDNLFTFSNAVAYVTIDGIDFTGANSKGIYRWGYGSLAEKAHNLTIKNCKISYSGTDAISMCSFTLNIENNTISESNGMAMDLTSSKNIVVRNNTITNSGTFPGMGVPFTAIKVGNDPTNLTSILIEYNSITNTGHNAISFGSDTTIIRNNFIDTFNNLLDDGAAIYGGSNAKLSNNIVLNGIGAWQGTTNTSSGLTCGIYVDDNSSSNEIFNNTVSNVTWIGIYLHNARLNNVHHNICYNNGTQLRTCDDINNGNVINNLINNNQFIAQTASQTTCDFTSIFNNLLTVATFDYNYYARPIDQNKIIGTFQPSIGSVVRTFEQWQSFIGQDINSKKSAVTVTNISDFEFDYNKSQTNKVVTLSKPMVDVTGKKYTGTITLLPYTSIILMIDNNPIKLTTDIESETESTSENVEIYPNPCQGNFTVHFTSLPKTGSLIEIYDLTGKKIASRLVSETAEEFNLSATSTNLYLVKTTINSKEKTHKLIIMK